MSERHSPKNHPLTGVEAIDVPVESYLCQVGEVFQAFRLQDSGTVSYGVLVDDRRWFVKESGDPSMAESLHRALHLNTKVQHPALPRLHNSFRTPHGLALVYEWVPGEVLNDPQFTREQRWCDPAHPHVRFRSLPSARYSAPSTPSSMCTFSWRTAGSLRPTSTMGASSTTSAVDESSSATSTSTATAPSSSTWTATMGRVASWRPRSSSAAPSSTRSPTCSISAGQRPCCSATGRSRWTHGKAPTL